MRSVVQKVVLVSVTQPVNQSLSKGQAVYIDFGENHR
jgi:hypothetical protein